MRPDPTDIDSRRVGVSTRRHALRIGGLGIAASALLAACSDDDEAPPPDTSPLEDEEAVARSPEMDIVLANTALSLAILAVDAYQIILESPLLERATFSDAAALFQSHHAEHRDALAATVEAAGETPFTTANPVVKVALVDPLVVAAAGEGDLVRLAYDLEQAAAQTYVYAATALSTPQLRSRVMTIGGIASRHATVLDALGELGNDRPAFSSSTNPLPEDAMVTG